MAGIIARKENEKLACEKFLARNKVQEMREIRGYKFVHFYKFFEPNWSTFLFKTFGTEESREFLCTLQNPTMFFVCIFGMLSFIFGPILNILQLSNQLAFHYIFIFSFFSEISPKNQNMEEASSHICWRMFKIGPNMNDTIPMIHKKIITCL